MSSDVTNFKMRYSKSQIVILDILWSRRNAISFSGKDDAEIVRIVALPCSATSFCNDSCRLAKFSGNIRTGRRLFHNNESFGWIWHIVILKPSQGPFTAWEKEPHLEPFLSVTLVVDIAITLRMLMSAIRSSRFSSGVISPSPGVISGVLVTLLSPDCWSGEIQLTPLAWVSGVHHQRIITDIINILVYYWVWIQKLVRGGILILIYSNSRNGATPSFFHKCATPFP